MSATDEEIKQKLVAQFGENILTKGMEYMRELYSFMQAIRHLAENKLNLEFNA